MKPPSLTDLKAKARKYGERFFKYDVLIDSAKDNTAWVELKEKRQRAADLWENAVHDVQDEIKRLSKINPSA